MKRSLKSESDADLFAQAMRDAKPLRKSKIAPPRGPSLPPVVSVPAPIAAPRRDLKPNPGLDRRTADRLKRGQMEIERRLDLHGLTERDAHAALDRAVRQAWNNGVRTLLVITGKGRDGKGALRRNLPRWLAAGENAAHVLRVETARPQHGGGGAYYVLLRRRRAP